jgi:hypothetical protein
MSAKWKIGSIDIFVSEQDISRELKRAELFILSAQESTFHFFGSGSEKRQIKGIVIGDTNRNAIITLATGNTSFTLTTPYGNYTTIKINSVKFVNHKYSGGTIDGVTYTADTTALYDAEIELIQT